MKEYKVIWEIEVDAPSAEAAAEQAREIQLDPNSHATVFQVIEEGGMARFLVDLAEEPGR